MASYIAYRLQDYRLQATCYMGSSEKYWHCAYVQCASWANWGTPVFLKYFLKTRNKVCCAVVGDFLTLNLK